MMDDYTDWEIDYGFHRSDWEDWIIDDDDDTIDVDASFDEYIDRLQEELEATFPSASIRIKWDVNTTGSLPASLKTRVWDTLAERDDYIPDVVAAVERVDNGFTPTTLTRTRDE